ncbi:nucleoside hydrolase [Planctomonas sp. JC2975]|uniref:nucleoside hydrolase n=1 Tax=Planctomonas sp. JC2975 TaxID=2729626 RepID=UPI0014766E31|nr:nucleoside hydrolase [Planctomonas sp. JC2975]NNC12498.1 nucleoside hydrolase [Planctomonas sp. JC2975]
MPTRLIMDCDTGTDDAIAIMAAAGHPDLELLAITTVNGNVALPNVTENTLRVLDHLGSTIPVYEGAERPIVRDDLPIPRDVLNADNPEFQAPLALPAARSRPRATAAADFLVTFYRDDANADVTLVATGPLTNVAAALRRDPALSERIPRLVLMGGAVSGGNVTAAAEFNIWVDADAAQEVLTAGIRDVVIMPLDATHSAPLTVADCDALASLGTPGGTAAATFIRHRIETDGDATAGDAETGPGAPVHDPLCVAYLVNPQVITESGRYPVMVETTGEHTLGELLVDRRAWSPGGPSATVAFRADHDRYIGFLRDALRD